MNAGQDLTGLFLLPMAYVAEVVIPDAKEGLCA
jgi:hypothetical protein